MRKASLVMAGIVVVVACAVTAWALVPADTPSEAVAQESEQIICEFDCADEYGFLYYCEYPTFGECCAQGHTACADHGGMEWGICEKGRLGLPCVPMDP